MWQQKKNTKAIFTPITTVHVAQTVEHGAKNVMGSD